MNEQFVMGKRVRISLVRRQNKIIVSEKFSNTSDARREFYKMRHYLKKGEIVGVLQ